MDCWTINWTTLWLWLFGSEIWIENLRNRVKIPESVENIAMLSDLVKIKLSWKRVTSAQNNFFLQNICIITFSPDQTTRERTLNLKKS